MTDAYVSAFEDIKTISPQGIRAGMRTGHPPTRMGTGTKHAYRAGESSTVCGYDLADLHPFPEIPFTNLGRHCPECAKEALEAVQ